MSLVEEISLLCFRVFLKVHYSYRYFSPPIDSCWVLSCRYKTHDSSIRTDDASYVIPRLHIDDVYAKILSALLILVFIPYYRDPSHHHHYFIGKSASSHHHHRRQTSHPRPINHQERSLQNSISIDPLLQRFQIDRRKSSGQRAFITIHPILSSSDSF